MIVDCTDYRDGHRQTDAMDVERAAQMSRRENETGFVWVDLFEPSDEELAAVQREFGLNGRAIEDAQAFQLRPKFEQYDQPGILFAVLRSASYVDEREEVEFGEVSILLSGHFVISVRRGPASDLDGARLRLDHRPDLAAHGSSSALWAILDEMVDDYVPVIEALDHDLDEVEDTVFARSAATTERIYHLRGEVTGFYRAVHPLLGPLDSLQRGVYAQVDEAMVPFFRDVGDHLKLVDEEAAAERDALGAVLQANIAVISLHQTELGVRQNDAMKQLTVIATIFLPLSFITGFFGMNFGWLVGHITPFWVFAVFGLGSLLASCVVLYVWFRRTRMIGGGSSAQS